MMAKKGSLETIVLLIGGLIFYVIEFWEIAIGIVILCVVIFLYIKLSPIILNENQKNRKMKEELKRREQIYQSKIEEIDLLSGYDFECYLERMFKKLSYNVKETKKSGDFGADLIISKQSKKTVIQAKRYSKKVGIKAVQETISAIPYYNADKGIVVTNNYFTNAAKELAKKTGIELWDREKLINITSNLNKVKS
jgi:HJR/Mrr/RecB family endonuclease